MRDQGTRPIPGPGYYWAKLASGDGQWVPCQVFEQDGGRWAETMGYEGLVDVVEWGPKMEPPR